MKKIIILLVSITFFASCKDSEEKKNKQNEKDQIETHSKIETVEDYLNRENKEHTVRVNNVVGDSVRIESLSVFKDKTEGNTYLVIKLEEKLDTSIVNNYRINARTFPLYLDDLRG